MESAVVDEAAGFVDDEEGVDDPDYALVGGFGEGGFGAG